MVVVAAVCRACFCLRFLARPSCASIHDLSRAPNMPTTAPVTKSSHVYLLRARLQFTMQIHYFFRYYAKLAIQYFQSTNIVHVIEFHNQRLKGKIKHHFAKESSPCREHWQVRGNASYVVYASVHEKNIFVRDT